MIIEIIFFKYGTEKGSEKMKMKNKENEPENDLAVGDLLPLPNLGPGDYAFSTKEQSLEWLTNLMGFYDRGDFHNECGTGVTLQYVSENTLRCVRVYDHPEPLKVLAMLKLTCEVGGIRLLLDGTLLSPVEGRWEGEHEAPRTTTPSEPPSGPSRHLGGAVSASTDVCGMEVA